MWLSVFALAASLFTLVYVSRQSEAPWSRKRLILAVLFVIALRAVFHIAFRLFDERAVVLVMGIVLLVVVLIGIGFGSRAVWKQMGARD